jgi:hypothetical protein
MPPERERGAAAEGGPTVVSSLAALDAKIKLLTQRIQIVENNEQVIGRTLVNIQKKLKDLETAASAGGRPADIEKIKAEILAEVKALPARAAKEEIMPPLEVEEFGRPARPARAAPEESRAMKRLVDDLKAEVDEIKYVLDTFNPLEYVRVQDLGTLIEEKIDEAMEKKRKPGEA